MEEYRPIFIRELSRLEREHKDKLEKQYGVEPSKRSHYLYQLALDYGYMNGGWSGVEYHYELLVPLLASDESEFEFVEADDE